MTDNYPHTMLLPAPHLIRGMVEFAQLPHDLSKATLSGIVAFLYAMIWIEQLHGEELYDRLIGHRANIRRETFYFILNTLEGPDPAYHLWIVDAGGQYQAMRQALNFTQRPEAVSDLPPAAGYD